MDFSKGAGFMKQKNDSFENLEKIIDEKAKLYRNQILKSYSKIAQLIKAMREEMKICNFKILKSS